VLLLFNISRPRRLIELSNVTQMASRTLAENSPLITERPRTDPYVRVYAYGGSVQIFSHFCFRGHGR
jgi:hypothetical protein